MEDTTTHALLRLDISVYRFKLDPNIVHNIAQFAKEYQQVGRKVFQSEWRNWLSSNQDDVSRESDRLTRLGFRGSPVDKMYKSARYYFRNKSDDLEKSAFPERAKEENKRRYVPSSSSLRQSMDTHVEGHIRDAHYTPATGFDHFCQTNVNVIRSEISALCARGETDPAAIAAKMKKTYKNRYYQISRSS